MCVWRSPGPVSLFVRPARMARLAVRASSRRRCVERSFVAHVLRERTGMAFIYGSPKLPCEPFGATRGVAVPAAATGAVWV